MRGGNLATSLPRRRQRGCPMAAYDRLPPELRRWLAEAALPWSAASVLRVWHRAGDPARALARLSALEAGQLARDGISRAAIR